MVKRSRSDICDVLELEETSRENKLTSLIITGLPPKSGLILSPRLKCSGMIKAHCNLDLPGTRDTLTSAPWSSWYYTCAPPCPATFVFIFCREGASPRCPGWSQTHELKQSSHLGLSKC
ncbi:hypothetical protein AAY473_027442 [Plecturocebus cupreus]